MGIPQLFDVIREYDRSTPVAQLAEEHYQRHGTPLRIAVDEADWRFNNLTQAQIYTIRDTSDQAFQGQEKCMFYRICRLLTLNIQLIFVFDGPGRPWKRGRRGQGKIDYRARDLLREMLRAFGIPSHEAPGEAEAECARMQLLRLVDAVWSQDSDCLMFGCTLWLRDDRVVRDKGSKDRSKENTTKNQRYTKVVTAQDLKTHLQIDRQALVLFAMLVGGDYDEKGLPGCGPSLAMKAVKKGLGPSLCMCRNQRECDVWALQLDEFLRTSGGRNTALPIGFPAFKTLVKYNSPKVSSDETLRNNAKLDPGYTRPINELKLLEITSSRFNIWGRLYMNWVCPVLLTRYMSIRNSSLPREVVHGINLIKRTAKKIESGLQDRVFERKLTFSPFGVTSLQKKDFEGERSGYWNGDKATSFDPDHRVEFEIPEYWLQKVLPPEVLDPPPPGPKRKIAKRKQSADTCEASEAPATVKRKRKTPKQPTAVDSPLGNASVVATVPTVQDGHSSVTPSMERQHKISATRIKDIIELSDSEDELRLSAPRLRVTSSVRLAVSQIIDFGSPSPSADEFELIQPFDLQDQQGLETPSRGIIHQTMIGSDVEESDDADLRLALRLSMAEHTAAPSTAHKSSRVVYQSPRASSAARKQAEKASRQLATSSRTKQHGVPKQQTPTRHTKHTSTPKLAERVQIPGDLALPEPESDRVPTASPEIDEIRAARVRHFQQAAAAAPTVDKLLSLAPSRSPTEDSHSAFRIPTGVDGIDCIDLTED
ncbi:hypothetical protein CC86DRAFT_37249 [Ophiobolus disseminans]|uniref:XPG-I domain-containing protein n=1 Tax=Ophiobolus disseminans TaxID=1469910 RepID=A0A6A6ZZ83_9PLEO|nr:hypothetical protein CC86DRAFT_37249 [Ophiobolus disseminans]